MCFFFNFKVQLKPLQWEENLHKSRSVTFQVSLESRRMRKAKVHCFLQFWIQRFNGVLKCFLIRNGWVICVTIIFNSYFFRQYGTVASPTNLSMNPNRSSASPSSHSFILILLKSMITFLHFSIFRVIVWAYR